MLEKDNSIYRVLSHFDSCSRIPCSILSLHSVNKNIHEESTFARPDHDLRPKCTFLVTAGGKAGAIHGALPWLRVVWVGKYE